MSTTHLLGLIDEIIIRKDAELAASKENGLPRKQRTMIKQQIHVLDCLSWAIANEPAFCFHPDFKSFAHSMWFKDTEFPRMYQVTRFWHERAFRTMDDGNNAHGNTSLVEAALRIIQ